MTAMDTTAADRRLDLALQAARDERRNRPVFLVVLAGLFVLAGGIYLLASFSSLGFARARFERTSAAAQDAVQVAARLAAMKARDENQSGPRAFEPNKNLLTDITSRAREAGFKPDTLERLIPSRTQTNHPSGSSVIQRLYSYEVRGEPLPVLLGWLNRCTREISGLEVYSVSLTPEAQSWFLKVTFSRWERNE